MTVSILEKIQKTRARAHENAGHRLPWYKIKTKRDATYALGGYGIDIDNDNRATNIDHAALDKAHSSASELVSCDGNLLQAPEQLRRCFGLPRQHFHAVSKHCSACPIKKQCRRVVDVRIANGFEKGKEYADKKQFGHSTAIFIAAEILFGWDQQNKTLLDARSKEKELARRARSAETDKARKLERRTQNEKLRADEQEALRKRIEDCIPRMVVLAEKEGVHDTIQLAADELRRTPEFRSSLSKKQLPNLVHYWIAERVIEETWQGDPHGQRKALVAIYHELCAIERSESASGKDADRKKVIFSKLRREGYPL